MTYLKNAINAMSTSANQGDYYGCGTSYQQAPVPSEWAQKQIMETNIEAYLKQLNSCLKKEEFQEKAFLEIFIEEEKLKLRIKYLAENEMSTFVVYRGNDGYLYISKHASEDIHTERLSSFHYLGCKIEVTYYPETVRVLSCFFRENDGSDMCIKIQLDKDDPVRLLMKEFQKKRVIISSRRMYHEYVHAMFRFLLENATVEEVYTKNGYYLNKDGNIAFNGCKNEDYCPSLLENRREKFLKTLPYLFNFLKMILCPMDKPVVLITDNMASTIEVLTNEERTICTADTYKKCLVELCKPAADYLFVVWAKENPKADRMVRRIYESLQCDDLNGKKILRMPLIIAKERLPEKVLPDAFYINLEDELAPVPSKFNVLSFCPMEDEIYSVSTLIHKYCRNLNGTEKFLRAAAYALWPFAVRYHEKDEAKEYINMVKRWNEQNQESMSLEGIKEIFLRELREKAKACKLYSNFGINAIPESFDELIFTDEEAIYMNLKTFKFIIKDLRNFSANDVKRGLVEEGVLQQGYGGSYMNKVGITTSDGRYSRHNMLKFSLDKIERLGEIGFIESMGGIKYEI